MEINLIDYTVQIKAVIDSFLTHPCSEQDIKDYLVTDSTELQDWVCSYLKEEFKWSTGIGIIEGAFLIVKEAIFNDNFRYE